MGWFNLILDYCSKYDTNYTAAGTFVTASVVSIRHSLAANFLKTRPKLWNI